MVETSEKKWYVLHTYSGYEEKVKKDLLSRAQSMGMQNYIFRVIVPEEQKTETVRGKKQEVDEKVFPGYVLVEMVMTDESWYVVRNTRGVTSFVGPGSKPVPLTDEEVFAMGIGSTQTLDMELGDNVKVIAGPFANSIGIIKEINTNKKTLVVKLSIFGRETPVELDFGQIEKI